MERRLERRQKTPQTHFFFTRKPEEKTTADRRGKRRRRHVAGAGRRFRGARTRAVRRRWSAGDAERAEAKRARGVEAERGAHTREDAPGAPRVPLGSSRRASSRRCRDGMRRAAELTADRREASGRSRGKGLPRATRGRPSVRRALGRRVKTPTVSRKPSRASPLSVVASYLGRSHATEVHGGSCGVFSAGKRDRSRSSRRAVREGCFRRGRTWSVTTSSTRRARRCDARAGVRSNVAGRRLGQRSRARLLDRAFAQFPEPSISACFVSIRRASGSELLARGCVRF